MTPGNKAEIYSEGKRSSDVFKRAHKEDYLAGYMKAIEDSCAPEMLKMLKDILSGMRNENYEVCHTEIEKLIQKATTL